MPESPFPCYRACCIKNRQCRDRSFGPLFRKSEVPNSSRAEDESSNPAVLVSRERQVLALNSKQVGEDGEDFYIGPVFDSQEKLPFVHEELVDSLEFRAVVIRRELKKLVRRKGNELDGL